MSAVEKCIDLLNGLTEAQVLRVLAYMESVRDQNNAEYAAMLEESEAEIERGEVFKFENGQFV